MPLKTKTVEEVTKAYFDQIHSLFGGSVKILTDNGTEFKNNSSRKSSQNLAHNFPSICHHTDHKAIGRYRDSTDS